MLTWNIANIRFDHEYIVVRFIRFENIIDNRETIFVLPFELSHLTNNQLDFICRRIYDQIERAFNEFVQRVLSEEIN